MKLIIFDLDDTLIDTSGCIAPLELKVALRSMVTAGLKIDSFEQSFSLLSGIDNQSLSGKETIKKFLETIGANERYLNIGVESYYGFSSLDFSVEPLPEVIETLNLLQQTNDLVIVSKGIEKVQLLKMERAGINLNLFKKIIITNNYYKKDDYQKVILDLNYLSDKVIVVGDRYDGDLLPAKELGLVTVHMEWGRGKLFKPKEGEVDYSINNLNELINIVKKCKP